MNRLSRFLAAAVLMTLPGHAMAADAAKCITHEEFRSAAAVLMPSLVGAAVNKCTKTLNPSAYLVTQGPALLTRYQDFAKGKEATVSKLIERLGPIPELDGVAPDKLLTVADVFISAAIQKELTPGLCADVSEGLAFLDPMPAENTIGLVDFILTKVQRDEAKKRAKSGGKGKGGMDFLCDGSAAAFSASK